MKLSTSGTRAAIALIVGVFFLSGCSSLFYQVVWLRQLGLVFGNTVYAAAVLAATFLAGLGIGGAIFGRWFRRFHPLLVYGLLEALIGTYGALSPRIFSALDAAYIEIYRSSPDALALITLWRALLAAVVLLPPTILMGGTLPVLVRRFEDLYPTTGKAVASLYATNTLGAAAGVALAGFATIPLLGLTATVAIAVTLNFFLAAVAVLAAFRSPADRGTEAVAAASTIAARGSATILAASLFMGLTSIANEVFWTRILVLHLGSSVYAFSLMLFAFLIGLGIGSAVIYMVIGRVDSSTLLSILEAALALSLGLQVIFFTRIADVFESIARLFATASYATALVSFLGGVTLALIVPTMIMGATFPLVVRVYRERRGGDESRAVGVVYLANTIGSILGSLLAGFVLIRLIGSQNGLFLMAAINLLIGIVFLRTATRKVLSVAALTIAAISIAAIIAMARPNQVLLSAGVFTEEAAKLLIFREDVSATVALREFSPENISLELNGVNVAGTAPDLIGTQKLQGHLPLLVHPNPKRVLHIGFGSGGTAWSVAQHPVEQIRIAEISPEVLEISGKSLRSVNHGVLSDPRVVAEINDGRNFVLATNEKFDVILSDSIHPRYSGNGSLYTKDYFELCRKRLTSNGVVSMWLPMYALTRENYLMILRAFSDVFPNTTVWYVPNVPNSFTIVIGRLEPGPVPLDRIASRMRMQVQSELAEIGIKSPFDVAACAMLSPRRVRELTVGIEPHVDDRPAVEYESGRLVDRELSWFVNFDLLVRAMSPLTDVFATSAENVAELERVDAARVARFGGHRDALYSRLLERQAASAEKK